MAKSLDRYIGYISGRERGPAATLARVGLSALAGAYWLAIRTRKALYDWGLLATRELEARVISVGNITTGGTGKTPLVVWLGRWLDERGVKAAILSRGYGDKPHRGAPSDETLFFQRRLPETPHLVGKNRYASGLRAIAEHAVACIVLDDGFQHLALGRDLDIVAVDALLPFGFGHLLPRGLLREPLAGLRRADLVVLTRCDLASAEAVADVARRVRRWAPACPIIESAHRPVWFYRHGTSERRPLAWVRGRKVAAFSALGNPQAFPLTLRALGARLVRHEAFRDHHWYSEAELAEIARGAREAGAEAVVTTEKDAVKIAAFPADGPPLHVLAVELELGRGGELLEEALERLLGTAAGPARS